MWDTEKRYGPISRILHWGLAALILWQALGGIGRWIFGASSPFGGFLFTSHVEIGTIILLALVLRCIWRIANVLRSSVNHTGHGLTVEGLGHMAIYAGMIGVVGCGVLQVWGRGRGLEIFGFTVLPDFTPPQELRDLARVAWDFHPYIALALTVLIAGHVGMALFHQWVKKDGTLDKML